MDAMLDPQGQALEELQAALDEHESAQEWFEAAIGTSSEYHAYERLRRATRRVCEADRRAAQSPAPTTSAPSMMS